MDIFKQDGGLKKACTTRYINSFESKLSTHPASTATLVGRSKNVQISSLDVEFGCWLDIQGTSKYRVNRRQ